MGYLSIYFSHLFHQNIVVFSVQVVDHFVEFISAYFILPDATVNGIVFLISFSDSSLLVCTSAPDFLSCYFTEFVD